jgi:iron complex transport system ATP-binding protein
MIARALAQDTSIVVLDEPTTHLDLYHKVSIVKLLKNLAHNTQKCIVLSTHDVDLAIQMCDDMIVMTPQHIYLDTPKNLIENNIFDTVFPKELISFDKRKGKFSFQ